MNSGRSYIKYLLKRLFAVLPVLGLVLTFCFFMMRTVTHQYTTIDEDTKLPATQMNNLSVTNALPAFYFIISPIHIPDSFYFLTEGSKKSRIKGLLYEGCTWSSIQKYLAQEAEILQNLNGKVALNSDLVIQARSLKSIRQIVDQWPIPTDSLNTKSSWLQALLTLEGSATSWTVCIPHIHWFGTNNAFHQWIVHFQHQTSTVDHRPVWAKIKPALWWTLALNGLSLAIILILALGIGEFLFYQDTLSKRSWLNVVLMLFHSIPRFFLGMLLILLFASSTVTPSWHIFPTPGFIDVLPGATFWSQWGQYGSALILPLIALILPSLAFFSTMYKEALMDEYKKPYAFKAKASGASIREITKKHLRKNAVLPLLPIIGLEIPALLGGQVIIEVLFNIPGMGRMMMQSILSQDWPVVFTILVFVSVVTVISKILVDLLMLKLDPRINLTQ